MKSIESIDISLHIWENSITFTDENQNWSKLYIILPNILPISIPVNLKNDPILWNL